MYRVDVAYALITNEEKDKVLIVRQAWDDSFRQVVTVVEELPDIAFDPLGEFTRRLGDTVDGAKSLSQETSKLKGLLVSCT